MQLRAFVLAGMVLFARFNLVFGAQRDAAVCRTIEDVATAYNLDRNVIYYAPYSELHTGPPKLTDGIRSFLHQTYPNETVTRENAIFELNILAPETRTIPDLPSYQRGAKDIGFLGDNASLHTLPEITSSDMVRGLVRLFKESFSSVEEFAVEACRLPRCLDIWYAVKTRTKQLCPHFRNGDSEMARNQRKMLMMEALPLLKEAYSDAIAYAVHEVIKCEESLLPLVKSHRVAQGMRHLNDASLSRKAETESRAIKQRFTEMAKATHRDELFLFLALRVKDFRKLAAIFDEDWEDDLKQLVDLGLNYDLGSHPREMNSVSTYEVKSRCNTSSTRSEDIHPFPCEVELEKLQCKKSTNSSTPSANYTSSEYSEMPPFSLRSSDPSFDSEGLNITPDPFDSDTFSRDRTDSSSSNVSNNKPTVTSNPRKRSGYE